MDAEGRRELTGLLARLADGDRSAFDLVYAALWPLISAFCARTLAMADSEDTAQVVLLKLFEQAPNFDRRADALMWALSIAKWEIRTVRQRYARSKVDGLDHASETQDPEKDPESLLFEREIAQAVQAVVGMLSPSDRETLAVTMNDEGDTTVPHATLRKRRQRALARLKEAWRSVYGT